MVKNTEKGLCNKDIDALKQVLGAKHQSALKSLESELKVTCDTALSEFKQSYIQKYDKDIAEFT